MAQKARERGHFTWEGRYLKNIAFCPPRNATGLSLEEQSKRPCYPPSPFLPPPFALDDVILNGHQC